MSEVTGIATKQKVDPFGQAIFGPVAVLPQTTMTTKPTTADESIGYATTPARHYNVRAHLDCSQCLCYHLLPTVWECPGSAHGQSTFRHVSCTKDHTLQRRAPCKPSNQMTNVVRRRSFTETDLRVHHYHRQYHQQRFTLSPTAHGLRQETHGPQSNCCGFQG
jgi:hypothetical protein